ncbi:DNA polymerase alpha subunit B [Eumeta japonica]|uniref:DNA polymerase alpha subunit B n=1 Tax=Eumeta variegata TaxID=151549 RepID=A0A4C1Z017_EUMVA|nr:DNA polymerase alpha subunit B [Eumeta japonica]
MATEELVKEQFEFLGIDIDSIVLAKCVKLCEEYNIDPETLVEQWMAYSVSNLNGAPPTEEHLNALERKEFSKRGADHVSFEKTKKIEHSPPNYYKAPIDIQYPF